MTADQTADPAENGQDFSAAFQEAAGENGSPQGAAPAEKREDVPGADLAAAEESAGLVSSDAPAMTDAEELASDSEPARESALDYKALYEREAQRLRSLEGRCRKERETWRRLEDDYRERLSARERSGEFMDGTDAEASSATGSADWPEQPAVSRRAAPPELLARREAERAIRPVIDALERERHVAAIASVHPDWRELAGAPELERFIDEQPGYVASAMRRVAECGDADEVIELLAHFKERQSVRDAARGQAERASRRARLAQNAEAVPSRPAGPPRGRPDKADFTSAWSEAARDRSR